MQNNPLPRLDKNESLRQQLRPLCRLKPGQVWRDPGGAHAVGCLNAADPADVDRLIERGNPPTLAVHDPPYNQVAFKERSLAAYIAWCRRWIANT